MDRLWPAERLRVDSARFFPAEDVPPAGSSAGGLTPMFPSRSGPPSVSPLLTRSPSMRLAPFRHVLRKPWLPAAAAALTLVGCGSSDEPKGKAAATSTAAAKPPAAATAPATSPVAKAAAAPAPPGEVVDLTAKVITPLVSPLDGPREYEEASEKPLVTSFPEAKNPDAKPAVENLPADDVLLGKPLVINGKVVPFEEVKRQVCLGRIGVTEIESAKLDVYIEQERQRRLNSGASKEDVAVAEQELAEFTAELEDEIKREYPGGDVTVADRKSVV